MAEDQSSSDEKPKPSWFAKRFPRIALIVGAVGALAAALAWVADVGDNFYKVRAWFEPTHFAIDSRDQSRVYFDFNDSRLTPEAKNSVDETAKSLVWHPEYDVVLQSYTDLERPAPEDDPELDDADDSAEPASDPGDVATEGMRPSSETGEETIDLGWGPIPADALDAPQVSPSREQALATARGRSQAVKDELVQQGIAPERIDIRDPLIAVNVRDPVDRVVVIDMGPRK